MAHELLFIEDEATYRLHYVCYWFNAECID
ncbi:hypothetical protein LAUMK191_01073 [Mycobacterium attenuatum]|uniref:Uncharacterized protein n=1 Tax=Mycobacterium attenuatum TaxID=2341086 RepID=A0A498PU10_9MYCO|nr:hypothetical protein LAUMK136_01076 [Mycobacterium attenuatum]VBA48124.1 hypothetical protein LAUMK191_01073 [Mycobacterium attenuatum]VBA52374.1 hypothetical protein LAUMK41_01162 [Mycobacterium attenuatum]